MRLVGVLSVVLAVATASPTRALTVGPPSPVCLQRTHPPETGLTLAGTEQTGRVVTLTLRSAANGTQKVNVLLPPGYDAVKRYPVLYLLHGFSGNYTDYVRNGIEEIVADAQLIVVMPDDGYNGSYTDWYGVTPGTPGDPPAWETYHIRELVPFVDSLFPTIGSRDGRAVAGISSGGFGTMKYAARHPDLFGAAASLSGAVDLTDRYPWYPTIDFTLNAITLLPGTGPPSYCKWGDPYTQRVVWEDSNPTYLASNLHGVAIWMSSGNGTDSGGAQDPTEYEIRAMNENFDAALTAAQVPHEVHFREGTHTWPFWRADLRQVIPWLMDRFGAPVAPPDPFSFRAIARSFGAFGWRFEAAKAVQEFTYLDGISSAGFTITGSGTVHVDTPPVYEPGAAYTVGTAGADGRLHFFVDLGPPNLVQQYEFPPSGWTTRTVVIAPA
jgi:S-formylglutathione hydrolase FrmB